MFVGAVALDAVGFEDGEDVGGEVDRGGDRLGGDGEEACEDGESAVHGACGEETGVGFKPLPQYGNISIISIP